MSYVLASEWGVSYATGTGIDGAILNVHKVVEEPNQWGGIGNVVKHDEFDGLTFPSVDAAQEFAFEAGLLKVYVPTRGLEEFNAVLDKIILQEIPQKGK